MATNIGHRWEMLTNEQFGTVPTLEPVTELEIIQHAMLIDSVSQTHLSNDEMQKCRERFRIFCREQWDNKN